jgi:hypothetical protein
VAVMTLRSPLNGGHFLNITININFTRKFICQAINYFVYLTNYKKGSCINTHCYMQYDQLCNSRVVAAKKIMESNEVFKITKKTFQKLVYPIANTFPCSF